MECAAIFDAAAALSAIDVAKANHARAILLRIVQIGTGHPSLERAQV